MSRLRADVTRVPRGVAELTADVVRALGAVGVVAGFLFWSPTDGGILALALPALLLPRLLGLRAGFDIVYGVIVLAAAWSNVVDLYRRVPGWDLVMHLLGTGVLSVVAYLALRRLAVVDADPGARLRRAPLVLVPVIGLALSALWEMVEWLGYTFVSEDIFVAYDDTIGDMAAGGIGAIAAGVLVALVPLERATAASVIRGRRPNDGGAPRATSAPRP